MLLWLKHKLKQEHEFNAKEIEDIKLNKEIRNKIRKIFLKEVKNIVILKNQVYKNIRINEEQENMAKQARIEDILIPVFDGANYSSWKIRLMILLEYKECEDPADRSITEADRAKEAEWKKKI